MLVDLHIHTRFSDGSQTPAEIVAEAREKGIGLISVCDHNTVGAYAGLAPLCRESGLDFISGVEIDCMVNGTYVHALVYGFDLDNPALIKLLKSNSQKMEYSCNAVIENMAKDYGIDLDDYEAFVPPPEMGGYKNSNYLLLRGYISSIPEYFPIHDKYGVPRSSLGLPELKDVCETVIEAGGATVLAHPWDMLGRDNFSARLREACEAGIGGLECFYPSHSPEVTDICVDFCRRNNLIITAGSDGHGTFNKKVRGVEYSIGAAATDINKLSLKGLLVC